ncbi:putative retroelement [Phytophthora cinnamomi]|uniref:putative retroelement n=1 Tax=Phytophthora cinnamomi TaxID=4785 RepID=UPI0035597C76|nr:putative retroelement [Phytophthora cinnamomi]
MVWGAFSAQGKSQLRGRQNSGHYIHTFSEYLLLFAHMHHGRDFMFQQDNASIHVSRETKEFMDEMDVKRMEWTARSPDWNPIENVWGKRVSRVYTHGRLYNSVAELEKAILLAWESIEKEYLQRLVESMPRRCLVVVKVKGGLTTY